ncbi:putative DNA helicase [Helianthus annuus]|nr:putative DNA helicase [Helianthus annuus]
MDELREPGVEEEYSIQLALSAKEDSKGIQIEAVKQISFGCVFVIGLVLIVKLSEIVLLPKRLCDPDFILFVFSDSSDCNCRFIFFFSLNVINLFNSCIFIKDCWPANPNKSLNNISKMKFIVSSSVTKACNNSILLLHHQGCGKVAGTQLYDLKAGGWRDLGMLDVMQIFGRAGKPQFDKSGEGIIITSHDKLAYYLRLLTSQLPIESQFISSLKDNLNAEVTLGTVTNVKEACAWLGYMYLFIRMKMNPLAYGIGWDEVIADPHSSFLNPFTF